MTVFYDPDKLDYDPKVYHSTLSHLNLIPIKRIGDKPTDKQMDMLIKTRNRMGEQHFMEYVANHRDRLDMDYTFKGNIDVLSKQEVQKIIQYTNSAR